MEGNPIRPPTFCQRIRDHLSHAGFEQGPDVEINQFFRRAGKETGTARLGRDNIAGGIQEQGALVGRNGRASLDLF